MNTTRLSTMYTISLEIKKMKMMRHIKIFMICVIVLSCDRPADNIDTVDKVLTDETENVVRLSAAQEQAAEIKLGNVEQKQISGTIRVSGVLDVPPQQLVSISVPLGGFLKDTKLLEGTRVKKGQVIATIENLDFIQIQQDYLDARTQLEFAKADYERQQQLAKENVNSQKVLQQSRTNYFSWQAKHNGLLEKIRVLNINREQLINGDIKSYINLFSPIDGYVTQVNVNIGKFVNPADVLFEIVDTEHLHAELIVFEKDVLKLKIGQKVRFTLANETSERTATVYLIGREISKERTVQIHCHIDREDKDLLPGMYLSAVVETGGNLVSALPDEAISAFQGKKYIFVSVPSGNKKISTFQMIPIEIAGSENGYTEVLLPDSLKQADIVIKGSYELLSKMKNTEEAE
jgi:membrane fusion protein, heavy metal efflux system